MQRALEVVGPADAGDVWERYVRPARWPQWSPQVRAVEYAEPVLREHTTGVVRGPLGVRLRFIIMRVSPHSRSWRWAVFVAGRPLMLSHRVEPVAGGTRTTLTIRGPAPLVLGYLPLARLALRRLVGV